MMDFTRHQLEWKKVVLHLLVKSVVWTPIKTRSSVFKIYTLVYENIVTVRIIYIGDYLLRIIYIYAGNGMGEKLVNINLRHQWRIQTFGGGGGVSSRPWHKGRTVFSRRVSVKNKGGTRVPPLDPPLSMEFLSLRRRRPSLRKFLAARSEAGEMAVFAG